MAGRGGAVHARVLRGARERAEPGGLLCQWAHTYDISADDLKSIARTFAAVFRSGTMWLVGEGDLLLISAPGRSAIRAARRARRHGCREGATPAALSTGQRRSRARAVQSVVALCRRSREIWSGMPVTHASRPTIGWRSSIRRRAGIYGRSTSDNAADLRSGRHGPARRRARGARRRSPTRTGRRAAAMLLKADAFGLRLRGVPPRAATLNSRNAAALERPVGYGRRRASRKGRTCDWLMAAAAREPANAVLGAELAHLLASTGRVRPGAAGRHWQRWRTRPTDPRAAEQLASIFADAGDADRLAPLAERLIDRFPGDRIRCITARRRLFIRGRNEEAIAAVQPLVALNPDHARAQNLLGAACATLGRRDCARAAFDASHTRRIPVIRLRM